MNTGKLFDIIKIFTMSISENSGDVTESWDEGVQVRASVKPVDGTRYLNAGELVDREVYEIELWDNDYSGNISILYDSKTLYPIRPVMRKSDVSMRGVIKIIAATKV